MRVDLRAVYCLCFAYISYSHSLFFQGTPYASASVMSNETSECPDDAVVLNGEHCYYLHNTTATQVSCHDLCLQRNATLPCIESDEENVALGDFMDDEFWIGYQRIDGEWTLLDGCEAKYTSWSAASPDGYGDCAFMSYFVSPLWGTHECDSVLYSCLCDHNDPKSFRHSSGKKTLSEDTVGIIIGCCFGAFFIIVAAAAWFILDRKPEPAVVSSTTSRTSTMTTTMSPPSADNTMRRSPHKKRKNKNKSSLSAPSAPPLPTAIAVPVNDPPFVHINVAELPPSKQV